MDLTLQGRDEGDGLCVATRYCGFAQGCQHEGSAKRRYPQSVEITFLHVRDHSVSSLPGQCQVRGSLAVILSVSKGKKSEIKKILVDMDKGRSPLDIATCRECAGGWFLLLGIDLWTHFVGHDNFSFFP